MSDDLTDDEVLSHYHTFEVPPKEFDPRTANPKELRKFGIPLRPDSETEPHLAAMWEAAIAGSTTVIKPQLAVDRVLGHRPHPLLKKPTPGSKFSPSGWAGVVVESFTQGINPPARIQTVTGEWTVPTITPVAGDPAQGLTVGFWVGIDGFNNTQVLQAGMAATITGKSVSYFAWTEWFPILPVTVMNFPINAGDVLTVLVCSTDTSHGFASFNNKTTGKSMFLAITPPAGVTSVGATAEWIVEGISVDLPDFSPVTFTNISAGSSTQSFNLSNKSDDIITNIGGTTSEKALTSASVISATSAQVKWLGSA